MHSIRCAGQTLSGLDDPRGLRARARAHREAAARLRELLFNVHHEVDIFAAVVDHTHEADGKSRLTSRQTYSERTVANLDRRRGAKRHALTGS